MNEREEKIYKLIRFMLGDDIYQQICKFHKNFTQTNNR